MPWCVLMQNDCVPNHVFFGAKNEPHFYGGLPCFVVCLFLIFIDPPNWDFFASIGVGMLATASAPVAKFLGSTTLRGLHVASGTASHLSAPGGFALQQVWNITQSLVFKSPHIGSVLYCRIRLIHSAKIRIKLVIHAQISGYKKAKDRKNSLINKKHDEKTSLHFGKCMRMLHENIGCFSPSGQFFSLFVRHFFCLYPVAK